jgi:hypothetical protein
MAPSNDQIAVEYLDAVPGPETGPADRVGNEPRRPRSLSHQVELVTFAEFHLSARHACDARSRRDAYLARISQYEPLAFSHDHETAFVRIDDEYAHLAARELLDCSCEFDPFFVMQTTADAN